MATTYEGIQTDELTKLVAEQTAEVRRKIGDLRAKGDQVSIGEMFEMQMLMNRLSQLSEMSTQVVGACHGALIAIARNVK